MVTKNRPALTAGFRAFLTSTLGLPISKAAYERLDEASEAGNDHEELCASCHGLSAELLAQHERRIARVERSLEARRFRH
jgi:hypothetical protein